MMGYGQEIADGHCRLIVRGKAATASIAIIIAVIATRGLHGGTGFGNQGGRVQLGRIIGQQTSHNEENARFWKKGVDAHVCGQWIEEIVQSWQWLRLAVRGSMGMMAIGRGRVFPMSG